MPKASYPVFITLLLLLAACESQKNANNIPENYPVTNPIIIDTAYTYEYVADIQAVQNVELRARVQGFLDKIYVDEGASVKQGQALFSISDREYQEELLKATAFLKSSLAEAKQAEIDMENTKRLVDKNVLSKTELDMAEAKLEALRAKVDEARANVSGANLNLSYTVIKAPYDGVINRIPNKVGSLIDEGTLLTTISDNSEVFAWFNMSESVYLEFVNEKEINGQKEVSLILANNQLYPYKGMIEIVESEIDKNTGNIAFRARFNNPEHLLKHGATGKIILPRKLDKALVIPQKSTFEIQEKLYVYVVDKNNTVQMKCIIPKLRITYLYVLASGLSTDETIIYEGIQNVKEGDVIIPDVITMSKIMSAQAK